MLWVTEQMSQTNSNGKTVTERIDNIGQLSVGDKIVFERRSLDDQQIESKRPLTVVDGASKIVRSTLDDPAIGAEPYETRLSAIEARGDWEGAKTYTLADAYNTFTGELGGIVDHDTGIIVEVARVKRAETDTPASGVPA